MNIWFVKFPIHANFKYSENKNDIAILLKTIKNKLL